MLASILLAVSLVLQIPKISSETVYRGSSEAQNQATLNENAEDDTNLNSGIKRALEDEFGENSIMLKVAECESGMRQFDENGNVLRGHINSDDVGVLQVNEHYHLSRAKELGIDIHTLGGNIEYARLLYDESGTTPWNWSRPCWGK